MAPFDELKNELYQITNNLDELISRLILTPGIREHAFQSWKDAVGNIQRQLQDEIVKIAVIGSIKSGKSTFVNSLFGRDFLKRGAGVITSIVTRIRPAAHNRAHLFFKSWDEVNSDINQAIERISLPEGARREAAIDIREPSDREYMKSILDTLVLKQLVSQDTRNVNCVLLNGYLKGYLEAHPFISSAERTQTFDDDQYIKHQLFAGDETRSLFLKDLLIEIDNPRFSNHVEIADCQGSDSSNPLHLALVQDYLRQTHLLIYIISSRTGMRQADIKFLSMIREMGLMDNMLVVINCDLDEHRDINDLRGLLDRMRNELALFVPAALTFAFSALFNLLRDLNNDPEFEISPRDLNRLNQWEEERHLAACSDEESARFDAAIHEKLTRGRYYLLLANHLERTRSISEGIDAWRRVYQRMLSEDVDEAGKILAHVQAHRGKVEKIRSMLKSTVDGTAIQIKKEIKIEVDRFFDPQTSPLMTDLFNHIETHPMAAEHHETRLRENGLKETLNLIFQNFRQDFDSYLAETVNPRIIGLTKKLEQIVSAHFESIIHPYYVMLKDAHDGYWKNIGGNDNATRGDIRAAFATPDIERVRAQKDLSVPAAASYLQYSVKVKTEAVVRQSIYRTWALLKKAFRRATNVREESDRLALRDCIKRIRRETREVIRFDFKSHRENLKFQYLLPLVDAFAVYLDRIFKDYLDSHLSNIEHFDELIRNRRVDREKIGLLLKQTEYELNQIRGKIHSLGEKTGSIG